ncbi:two-component sensor histidine kinase [Sporanaerobium hydrogeniformans]|uniref:Two-component sensor histidine kinase n=1 Tax=Sporanaerobium hydrogeniformans TaxID=3072179 RepID=A0AC61DCQ8_9FIRM|nr:sensor histidine kinase [Sporanaerobium hydrogeniformans]PHV70818.1 two-component sensor histidine kinase [Sporanaerobium hydrogeniformans]
MVFIKKIKNFSLKNKIFVSNTLIITVALLFFAIFANQVFSEELMERTKRSSIREIDLININLDTMINSIEDYSRVIASEYRLQKELVEIKHTSEADKILLKNLRIKTAMSEIVSNIISPNTQIAGIAVFEDKKVIYSGHSIDEKSVNKIIHNDYLETVYQIQRPTWTGLAPLEFIDHRKKDVFSVSKLIRDRNTGEALGVVTLFVDEVNISNIYTKNIANAQGSYYIVDENNKVISSYNKADLYKDIGQVLKIKNSVYKQLQDKGNLLLTDKKIPVLYSMKAYGKFGWKVISVSVLEEIVSEKNKIRSIIIWILILCVIIVFITSYIISHTVTKPIYLLLGTMEKIKDGNIKVRACGELNGEVGVLANGFNMLMNQLEQSMEQIYKEQKLKRENEFKLLQSQIKPHFLYNTMETISSFIKLDMKEYALTTIQYLSNFYKISLSRGNEMITVEEEVKIIESYLSIQRLRYAEYMDYTLDFDNTIFKYTIPKLTIQPLVENAIYHGLKQSQSKGIILVKGYIKEGSIIIEVLDTGVGLSKERLDEISRFGLLRESDSRSFGLRSIDERLKLLYGSHSGISIKSVQGEYTLVTVSIPLDSK